MFKFELGAFVTPIVATDYHARTKAVVLERWSCETAHGTYRQYLCAHYKLGDYTKSVWDEEIIAPFDDGQTKTYGSDEYGSPLES